MCRTPQYSLFSMECFYDVESKTVRNFLGRILKLFAGTSATVKKDHLNPGLVYIQMLFAGFGVSLVMQSMKSF